MSAKNLVMAAAGASSAPATYIEDVFSTYLYAGTGANRTITNNIDLSTKGGLVWIKGRGVDNHMLFDTVQGADKRLNSNTTAAVFTGTDMLTSFGASGFSLGADTDSSAVNAAGDNYASWTFRKQPKFFDVVTYTGTGSNRTVAHNLGSTPGCMIVKSTSTNAWIVYHRSLGATQRLVLNATSTAAAGNGFWNDTEPTSSVFTVGTNGATNNSGETFVAYLFAHDAGGFGLTGSDNVISCGSFTTDGSGNATVSLGYEPQYILMKSSNTVGQWKIYDTMRGMSNGGASNTWQRLQPNTSDAESTDGIANAGPNATGFSISGQATSTYIYIAIRRGPMKVPTDATKVFDTQYAYSSSPTYRNTILTDGFIQFAKESGYNKDFYSRLTGKNYLSTNSTAAESTNASLKMDIMNGVYTGVSTPPTYLAWLFRRAPSFFDEVCYTGTGSARTVTHNLGVAPELIITKKRSSTSNWATNDPSQSNPWSGALLVNSDGAFTSASSVWNDTAPTSSVFSVGTADATNVSGQTYVAYLFATCPGVSKVGSYTGTGTTKQVDCGFAAGARFVLIKRTDSTGAWYVWDSARGIVSGNDPYLLLNSTAAEVTSTDYVDTYAAGFEISSTAPAAINASGGTYIYLAIA